MVENHRANVTTNTAARADVSQLAANEIAVDETIGWRTQRTTLVLGPSRALYMGMGQSSTLHRHYATQVSISLGAPLQVRTRALMDLSRAAGIVGNVFLLVLLAAGIAAAFMGGWWGRGWIWAALGLLVLISFAMTGVGSRPLTRVRQLLGETGPRRPKGDPKTSPAIPTDQQLAVALAAVNPWLMTAIGGGGLALILWLMMFKPF